MSHTFFDSDSCLVDFGTGCSASSVGGQRLEQIGGILVRRPLLQQNLPSCHSPAVWMKATAEYDCTNHEQGKWTFHQPLPDRWQVRVVLSSNTEKYIRLLVRPSPSGQIGFFLEQVNQWKWLYQHTTPGKSILSLFAHSGAATLALALAGASVTHVDASKQAMALARANAKESSLGTAPIRWICDDVRSFVAREIRRGSTYHGVVLDPPSWGHGPKGQSFSIHNDLKPLLKDLAKLLYGGDQDRSSPLEGPVLLTCHSPDWHHVRLREALIEALGLNACNSGRLDCTDAAGRTLNLGDYARWVSRERM